jgi:transposase
LERIFLSPPVRAELEQISRQSTSEARLVERAQIILLSGAGLGNTKIAHRLGSTKNTVRKWRNRFMNDPRVDSIFDVDRSGRPSVIPVDVRCEVVKIACSHPSDWNLDTRNIWTLGELKKVLDNETGWLVSEMEISRILRDSEIRPHRLKYWLHSPDPDFKNKVRRICKLYLDPPKGAKVVCVDEKTGIQALGRKYRTKLPVKGRIGKIEFEYIRHGTTSLMGLFEVKTGKAFGFCNPTRTTEDTVNFMELAAKYYRGEIYVIWDNLNTHSGPKWEKFKGEYGDRIHFVYTPIHASWVNQIEIWFGILTQRVIRHGIFTSVDDLIHRIEVFIRRWNEKEAHPFDWKFRGEFKRSTSALRK